MKTIYRNCVAGLTLVLGSSVLLCSCGKDKTVTAVQTVEELPRVQVAQVHSADVPQMKSYTATVEADNLNNISPASPNRIRSIAVEPGDRVHRGQTLVVLDSSTADQLQIQYNELEREYNRATELLRIGAGTQQAVDQLKAQLDAASSQLRNVLDNTVLTSPVTGVVTARNYDPGDMTGSLPVLTVGQLSPSVKVLISISENDLKLVKNGMKVDLTFDAFPGEHVTGTITRIHPIVDTATRTFRAEVEIPNPGERILPGMFARVNLNMGAVEHVLVPDRAVVKQPGSGNRYVYILRPDSTVVYERVELGQRLDDNYELLSGVDDGAIVVVSGQTRLADGVKVEVVK